MTQAGTHTHALSLVGSQSGSVAPIRRVSPRVQTTAIYSLNGGLARFEEAVFDQKAPISEVIRWAQDRRARMAIGTNEVELTRIEFTIP